MAGPCAAPTVLGALTRSIRSRSPPTGRSCSRIAPGSASADMGAAAVDVEDLVKSYGGKTAVKGITFDIRVGETFALLGPNGAGKSTTIEILEGYRHRSAGSVRVLGVDPHHGGLDWKARLGIVL